MRRGLGIAVLLLASSCSLTGGTSRDEVFRTTSPDNRVDAVLIETNGGATTSYGYEVHVVRKGERPTRHSQAAFLYAALRAPFAYGVNLRWFSDDSIAVEYQTAQSATVMQPPTSVVGRVIGVRLAAGVLDPMARPGSMHRLPQDPR